MIKQTPYNCEDLYGFLYEFGEVGDELPLHNHANYNNPHNVMVMWGTVIILEEGKTPAVVSGGDMPFELPDPQVKHIIRSLAPRTVILNLYYHGRPYDWDEVTSALKEVA